MNSPAGGIPAIDRLAACLGKLPGIGRRSGERMALRLARDETGLVEGLVEALEEVRKTVCACTLCGCATSRDRVPCRLCDDPARDDRVLCVVEEADDIVALERSGGYRGRYHALMGKLSPMKGEGPANLRVDALVKRLDLEPIEEVVLAMNTDVEGDATASYLHELMRGRKIRLTRLAYGLPAGSGIAYADAVTLTRAFSGRQGLYEDP